MIRTSRTISSDTNAIMIEHSPWGDGFADDTLEDFARVRSWEEVSSDEYIRVFPRLISRPNPTFIAYLERSLCILKMETYDPGAGASHPPSLRSAALDPATLKSIEEFSFDVRRGTVSPYQSTFAEQLAFHTALHPVYFWPESLALHQRLTALAWLGIVMRGRPAYLPHDVAEYFAGTPCFAGFHIHIPDASGRWLKLIERRLEGYAVCVRPSDLKRSKKPRTPIQGRALVAKSKSLLGDAWQILISA